MIRSFEILVLLVASVVFVCAEVEAVEAVAAEAEAWAEVAVADEDWDEGISEELKILLIQVAVVLAVVLLIAFACAYCGWLVGSHKGRGRQGFWLGFFLGPMGVMTVGFLPAKESNPFKSDR